MRPPFPSSARLERRPPVADGPRVAHVRRRTAVPGRVITDTVTAPLCRSAGGDHRHVSVTTRSGRWAAAFSASGRRARHGVAPHPAGPRAAAAPSLLRRGGPAHPARPRRHPGDGSLPAPRAPLARRPPEHAGCFRHGDSAPGPPPAGRCRTVAQPASPMPLRERRRRRAGSPRPGGAVPVRPAPGA